MKVGERVERHKLTVTLNPKKEKTQDDDSRKKNKLANPMNQEYQTDKVNYAHKVFVSHVKRNHTSLCRLRSIICRNCNEIEHFAKSWPKGNPEEILKKQKKTSKQSLAHFENESAKFTSGQTSNPQRITIVLEWLKTVNIN